MKFHLGCFYAALFLVWHALTAQGRTRILLAIWGFSVDSLSSGVFFHPGSYGAGRVGTAGMAGEIGCSGCNDE